MRVHITLIVTFYLLMINSQMNKNFTISKLSKRKKNAHHVLSILYRLFLLAAMTAIFSKHDKSDFFYKRGL